MHSLPFGSIKIDQRFVNGYSGDEKAKSVKLRPLGCQKAQGYYFHRPAEFASFRCETGAFYYQNEEGNDGAKEDKSA
ncbi:diguanylate cyclase [Raoultella planticola]|uniref:diguanylate cyclase n=1 Tax=Raoultella planticola TaxID=575 RepID=UPI0034E3B248